MIYISKLQLLTTSAQLDREGRQTLFLVLSLNTVLVSRNRTFGKMNMM